MNPAGACEFHPVAGLGIAQVLAALIVTAVMDLNRVAETAGFVAALSEEINQLQRVHLTVSDTTGQIVDQSVIKRL